MISVSEKMCLYVFMQQIDRFFSDKTTHLLYVSLIGVYVDRRSWTY